MIDVNNINVPKVLVDITTSSSETTFVMVILDA
jgi:hypothetical protein